MTAKPHLEARESIATAPRPSRGGMPRRSCEESGYAYLFTLFLLLAVIVASTTAMERLVTQGRREREQEVIWRGQQYVRALRLYSRKTGKPPQTLDDLKKGTAEIHFLRAAAYINPVNTTDGTWRFIYANSGGQIFGSVRYATYAQMMLMDQLAGRISQGQLGTQPTQIGTPASALSSLFGAQPGQPAAQSAQTAQPSSSPTSGASNTQNTASADSNSQQPGSGAANGTSSDQNSSGQSSSNPQAQNPILQLKPTGPVDGPVLGAFLTGVAGTTENSSVKIYLGGKNYQQWEFVWNPLEDQATALQQGLNSGQQGLVGQPAAGANGTSASPNGTSPTGPADNGNPGSNGASPSGQTSAPSGQTPQISPQ